MPNPKLCNRITDPVARRRCLNYEGEFAKPEAGPKAPRPTNPMSGGLKRSPGNKWRKGSY